VSDSPAQDPRWIGRVIDDRYKIVEALGVGGMGAVFVAEHLRLRKQVAFKTIKAEFAAHTQAEARFQREALATGRLDHPHVASAIDYGPLPEGGFYLVTQLVRGESLSKRLDAGAMPWPQVCLLGSQIADALAAAHAIGIVHRDLKPDNILLEQRRDGALHVRVVDFGIARVSGENAGTIADIAGPLTRMGAVVGTPGYMPPEQGTGQQVDFRVDLYALGVVLWEAVTGQQLWQGDTLTELLARQLGRPAPSLRGEVPDAMAALIDRMLARKPSERPASALEVRDELRRLAIGNELAGVSIGESKPAASTSAAPTPVAPTPAEVTLADPRPAATVATRRPSVEPVTPPLRIPRAVWLGGVAVVLAIFIVALYGVGGGAKRRMTIDEQVAEVPAAYAEDVKMLLTNRHAQVRALASAAIAEAPAADRAQFPEYIRDLAELERGSCDERRAILGKLAAAEEVRALPALKVVDGGKCGLRDELARTIAGLEAED
jgi:serine/threonine-protein kinase